MFSHALLHFGLLGYFCAWKETQKHSDSTNPSTDSDPSAQTVGVKTPWSCSDTCSSVHLVWTKGRKKHVFSPLALRSRLIFGWILTNEPRWVKMEARRLENGDGSDSFGDCHPASSANHQERTGRKANSGGWQQGTQRPDACSVCLFMYSRVPKNSK